MIKQGFLIRPKCHYFNYFIDDKGCYMGCKRLNRTNYISMGTLPLCLVGGQC